MAREVQPTRERWLASVVSPEVQSYTPDTHQVSTARARRAGVQTAPARKRHTRSLRSGYICSSCEVWGFRAD
eukprot:2231448-Rhodomonas_salina.2